MEKGKIGVTTENIFPIIKQFLYSDQEIFLRELVSNAVDATQKLNTLSAVGEFKGELGDQTINVKVDKKAKTITISDRGVGMTSKEIDKYINQIAFSGATDFVKKYKDKASVIGMFGLGFYSGFMVAERIDIITKSHKRGKAVKWSCDGSPEFTLEENDKKDHGTDIVLHVSDDSKEYLEESKINELLNKYCKFLPIAVAFGNKKDYKDGKELETDELNIINDTTPLWTKTPSEIKDEEYKEFYQKLYPMSDEPMFNIHLNVDYPFNLTGILYFPKIKTNIELQKNKIQLFSNQVFVTDSVEGIVPEFLTLLHGVLDSPDIPLNVSRSFLQSDANVKKISNHITKKVADKLHQLFKDNRTEYDKKWDDLSIFVKYGMLTEEKFYEKAEKFCLLKNTEGKAFTFDEYKEIIKENQTDKNNSLVYLYATNVEEQYSHIEGAKSKGYDVVVLDGQLDSHFVNHLEQKMQGSKFIRVDSDVADKIIEKEDQIQSTFAPEQENDIRVVFKSQLPEGKINYDITFEGLSETENPVIITQSEFMRRMKDMSALGGGGMNIYGDLPDSFNLVVNTNHKLVKSVADSKDSTLASFLKDINNEIKPLEEEKSSLETLKKDKKDDEVPQSEKDQLEEVSKKITEVNSKKDAELTSFGKDNNLVKQLIDLALLSNNMLKGESLNKFVKRSIDLIK